MDKALQNETKSILNEIKLFQVIRDIPGNFATNSKWLFPSMTNLECREEQLMYHLSLL